jgi:hypothetical protein
MATPRTKKAQAARRRGRILSLLNAISDLHHDDLHLVLKPVKSDPNASAITNLKKFVGEITKIAKDYHHEETGEARTRIWEYVLKDIYVWGEVTMIEKARPKRGHYLTLKSIGEFRFEG